jgi:hypothetical protein
LNVGCHKEYLEPFSIYYQQILSYGNTIVTELNTCKRKKYYYNLQVETCLKTVC